MDPPSGGTGGTGGGGVEGASGTSGLPPSYENLQFGHNLAANGPAIVGIGIGAVSGGVGGAIAGGLLGEYGEAYLDAYLPQMSPAEYDSWVAETYPSSGPQVGEDGFDPDDYAAGHS